MRLSLFYPVKYQFVTQRFGDASAWKLPNGKIVGGLTKPEPGAINFYIDVLKEKGHNGLDIAAMRGLPIYASHAGVVVETETSINRGLCVHLRTELEVETASHTGYCKTIYLHLQGINVKVGDKIKVGDLLGWADNTGASGGDHLHYGVAPCDINGKKLYPQNGYGGYIDPTPYMQNMSAIDARGYIVKILEAFAIYGEKLADLARSYK